MDINKLNFENIIDLKKVLKMHIDKLRYISPQELENIIKHIKRIVTIHLYPFSYTLKKEKCLLDLHRWSYHQIYLFVNENQIFWTFGHGDTSGSRYNHNYLLDFFIKNKFARKKVITAIIATFKGEIASYYFYEGFAYSDNDIGSNWNHDIIKKIESLKLPHSRARYVDNFTIKSLFFVNGKKEIEIYRQTEVDLFKIKLDLSLQRLLINKKANPLKETFGILKLKRKTEDILKDIDKEGWNKD